MSDDVCVSGLLDLCVCHFVFDFLPTALLCALNLINVYTLVGILVRSRVALGALARLFQGRVNNRNTAPGKYGNTYLACKSRYVHTIMEV